MVVCMVCVHVNMLAPTIVSVYVNSSVCISCEDFFDFSCEETRKQLNICVRTPIQGFRSVLTLEAAM